MSEPAVTDKSLISAAVFKDCAVCPQMVLVRSGAFFMGSPERESETDDDEFPQHEVAISKEFAVGKFEITRFEFNAFVVDSGHQGGGNCRGHDSDSESVISWQTPGFRQTDDHPVVCVNWYDAKAYASWLSQKTGYDYRLLSEAEWEYVARAGTSASWPWGSSADEGCAYSNGADLAAAEALPDVSVMMCNDDHVHTSPVGSYQANGFGLHDLIGNVWEWTEDCWNDSYVGAPGGGAPWLQGDCRRHPLRGGSWDNAPAFLRSASRIKYIADARMYNSFGFRVAKTLN